MKILSNMKNNTKIPIGCSIDHIMGGGVEKGTLTQFYGPPGSGKTNIALNLAVETAKNGKKVIYVDTEGGISIERIKQLAGDEFNNLAGRIIVFEPTTFQEQNETLNKIQNIIESKKEEVDVIILDSAVALYRLKEKNYQQFNRELGMQMALLSKIARKYNVAVIITNHIYSVFDDNGGGTIEPVGGTILKYWSKTMVELEKGDIIGERIAILKRHRSRPEGLKARFKIVDNGLRNCV
ncbi:MAG: DNA repair and recombination protein RadB [Methanomicrobiales archaeon]